MFIISPACFCSLVVSILCLVPVASQAGAVDFEDQAITIALTQEPPNLNTMQTTDLVSFFVMGHAMEGLLRYDNRSRLSPGVAKSWSMEDKQVTFQLNPDARWSDGSPVTSADFLFAWRNMVNPKFAAPYATILYPIKNARAIHQGELAAEHLGVDATDPLILRVELENPTPWFLSLMIHLAYFPVPEHFYLGIPGSYGAEPEYLLSNGPFMLTNWVHGSSLVLEKNPHYWQTDAIQLNRINVGYITEDNRTRLNLFRDNAIALVRLDRETVNEAAQKKMKVRTFVSGGLAFIQFNMQRTPINKSLRKAIQSLVDPEELVNRVIAVPGYKAARSFFPSWLMGVDGPFQEEHPPMKIDYGVSAAQRHIKAARDLAGGKLPDLTVLTVNSPTGMKIAEYIQGLIARDLELAVRIDNQTIKQYLAKARLGEFDIAISSWYPDFDDVLTYADLLGSWNPNNRGRYQSREYDDTLMLVQRLTDPAERYTAAATLQDIIQQEAMVIPLLETGSAYLVNKQLKGVVRRVIGPDPDYTYARVVP